jgi:hypothetical protein
MDDTIIGRQCLCRIASHCRQEIGHGCCRSNIQSHEAAFMTDAPIPTVPCAQPLVRRTLLLASGIASSVLYGSMIWAIRYDGYSLVAQVPSELTAIGSPTRSMWMWLGAIYTGLVAAFGWGVWTSAVRNPHGRVLGGLILAYGSLGLLWPFAAMHPREVLAAGGATWTDTMHVVLGAVTVLLMFLVLAFGAAAFGSRFRLYTLVSGVVLLVFGALTFLDAPRLQANLPTPWIGLWERINITVFLAWIAVLATVLLLRRQNADAIGVAVF